MLRGAAEEPSIAPQRISASSGCSLSLKDMVFLLL